MVYSISSVLAFNINLFSAARLINSLILLFPKIFFIIKELFNEYILYKSIDSLLNQIFGNEQL